MVEIQTKFGYNDFEAGERSIWRCFALRDNYDFSDAIRNPFAGKINGKYTVTVHYDFTDKEKLQEEIDREKHADKNTGQQQA